MREKKSKRLCWNCNADVDKDSLYCLYCGMDLSKQKENCDEPVAEVAARAAPAPVTEEAPTIASALEPRNSTLATILLSGGALVLIFSLFLVLFSKEGVLKMEWDASFWFAYMILAVGMLFLGYRALRSTS